ncbi:MAG: hypothetical protein GEV05_09910 [Betaproteobacteria bacterium]|nr:hypothetical protein [Betaproteobacteria bacterium]
MRRLGALLVAAALAGCATTSELDQARQLTDAGRLEEALARFEKLTVEHPGNAQYRAAFASQRELVVNRWLAEAETLRASGAYTQAQAKYQRVLDLLPGNARATAGLSQIEAERNADALVERAQAELKRGDTAAAEARLREALAQAPQHRAARTLAHRLEERRAIEAGPKQPRLGEQFSKTISLQFRDANLRQVFEIISRAHGINFVFDKDVRPDMRVTIFVRDTAIEDIVKLVLATNQLERKVLNENSILIYPNTPAKAREYQDLVTRSFYLGNADAKQTLNLVRALVKTRDVYIDEKLNLLVMRDTPAAVHYAEKLILNQDLAEPEVMLEVEVLEVSRTRLQELGVRFPDRINFGPLGIDGGAPPSEFELSSSALRATVANPALILNMKLQDGSTNVLANPRIRVRNREKARIHIGEKVPVVTTTSTANVGVSASVNYLEVGLKLDVEPNVYLDDEIAIKVELEVSNIIETLDLFNTRAYRLGSRNATTTLRLRDGETQVLAGLIQDEDRRTANKVPVLGDIPILGRLFSSNNDTTTKNEIVLLITPHVIRNILRPESRFAEIASGTDAAIGAEPLKLRTSAPSQMSISSGQSGAGPARPAPQAGGKTSPVRTAAPVDLVLSAPAQAAIGSEFSVQVGLSSATGVARRTSFELAYEPALLQPVGDPQVAKPGQTGAGRIPVTIDLVADSGIPTREVRFRVIAKEPGEARLSVEGAAVLGNDDQPIPGNVPPAHTLRIVPK